MFVEPVIPDPTIQEWETQYIFDPTARVPLKLVNKPIQENSFAELSDDSLLLSQADIEVNPSK